MLPPLTSINSQENVAEVMTFTLSFKEPPTFSGTVQGTPTLNFLILDPSGLLPGKFQGFLKMLFAL